jgi:uncharacterized membrane protein YfcA
MNELFAIFFGLPSFLILAILAYVGIVGTIISTYHAIKNKDYNYLFLLVILTICSAMFGWTLGDFL